MTYPFRPFRSRDAAIGALLAGGLIFASGGCQAVPHNTPHISAVLAREAEPPRPATVPLGVNIDLPDFVDAMKNAVAFQALEGTPFGLDAQGWPTTDAQVVVFDNRVNMPWDGPDPHAVPSDDSGTYHLSFTGEATVTPGQDPFTIANQVYNPATKTTTADLIFPKGKNLLVIQFKNTHGGVKHVRLIRPGYPADTKQIFTTTYLNALKPFRVLRLVNYASVNNFPAFQGKEITREEWTNRRLTTDATQADMGGKHGGAWEYIILLANQMGADVWVNVPISATDDYVTRLAALFKNGDTVGGVRYPGLKPGLHIYVEYSNEVWNWSFQQNWWNSKATEQAAKPESDLLSIDGNKDKNVLALRRYAMRTVEMGQIFRKVYGPSDSGAIRPVLLWQESNVDSLEQMLRWIAKAYGPPRQFVYGVGNAPYWGSDDAAAASLDTLFPALTRATDDYRAVTEQTTALATYFGLKNVAYEGGYGNIGTTNIVNKIDANRDPRMKALIQHSLLDNWFAAGGDVYCYYSFRSSYGQWGSWGLLQNDLTRLNGPKYQGAVEVVRSAWPPLSVGTLLPSATGQSVTLDESRFEGSQTKPGAPMTPGPGEVYRFLLRTAAPATYSIQVAGSNDPGGTVRLSVDGQELGNKTLPETVSVRLAPGLHALWVESAGTALTHLGLNNKITFGRTQ